MTIPQPPAPTFEDVWRMFQETDRKFQETDRKFQETDRKFQETDRKIQEVTQNLGRLGNRLGDFVEELVKPGLVRVFQGRGLKVHRTMQNLVCRDDHDRYLAQVDLVAVDSDTVIAVECKSQFAAEDVTEHLERLALFKGCWPEYRTYTLLGGVAAMVLPEDVGRFAYRQGLYVLAQSGETLEIRNDARFTARTW
jgi:hypothetical protein